jgi:hypothetical protein
VADGARDNERASREQEFAVLARYLGTPDAGPEVAALYLSMLPLSEVGGSSRFDRWLVRVARLGPRWAALADCYARVVYPYGLLRRKLTLTLALLESGRSTHRAYDTGLSLSPAAAWTGLLGLGIRWVIRTILALVLLGPLHLASAVMPGDR